MGSLIEAERAFSRTSAEKGIREAFLTWLAPDAVVFRPAPVEGRPVYEKMDPADPTLLTWEPEYAEIAASGELGYTTGPYEVRPNRGAEPTGFGHYVSVWKKQPDGTWRVFLDIGVQHDPPAAPAPVTDVSAPGPKGDLKELSLEAQRDEGGVVANRMARFDFEVGLRGYRKALTEYATDDIRIYRPGRRPSVGRSSIKSLFPRSAGRVFVPPSEGTRLKHEGRYQVHVAWSGDLAVTFGTSDRATSRSFGETAAFLKVWRKDAAGAWMICLDIELPVPADKEKKG